VVGLANGSAQLDGDRIMPNSIPVRGSAAQEDRPSDTRDEIRSKLSGVGIALSGGGHRATLFGLGVLLYLARVGRNSEVLQIASVSGGSIASAYVAHRTNYRICSSAEFDKVTAQLGRQIADRGTLFAESETSKYIIGILAITVFVIAALTIWIWSPHWLPNGWLVPAAALALLIGLCALIQLRGTVCERAFARTLFSGSAMPRHPDDNTPLLHIICATEIQTGNGAYFLKVPFERAIDIVCDGFETRRTGDLQLATIVRASTAVPFYFPAVRLPGEAVLRLALGRAAFNWERHRPSRLLLVDGGVRDNLGIEWLDDRSETLTRLIVVSASANRIFARERRIGFPLLGELISLMLVRALPYHTREQNRRKELLRRFLSSYEGLERAELAGVLIHIEESPFGLASALRRSEAMFQIPEDTRVAEALAHNPAFPQIQSRAEAVCAVLEKAEDVQILIAKRATGVLAALKDLDPGSMGHTAAIRYAVADEWKERALRNARISTNLSKIGRETAAELIRHAFALAMAKLHIIYDYPLCALPSIEEIIKMVDVCES
jgi:predicted acylesterase/phospholipase RssA